MMPSDGWGGSHAWECKASLAIHCSFTWLAALMSAHDFYIWGRSIKRSERDTLDQWIRRMDLPMCCIICLMSVGQFGGWGVHEARTGDETSRAMGDWRGR